MSTCTATCTACGRVFGPDPEAIGAGVRDRCPECRANGTGGSGAHAAPDHDRGEPRPETPTGSQRWSSEMSVRRARSC